MGHRGVLGGTVRPTTHDTRKCQPHLGGQCLGGRQAGWDQLRDLLVSGLGPLLWGWTCFLGCRRNEERVKCKICFIPLVFWLESEFDDVEEGFSSAAMVWK